MVFGEANNHKGVIVPIIKPSHSTLFSVQLPLWRATAVQLAALVAVGLTFGCSSPIPDSAMPPPFASPVATAPQQPQSTPVPELTDLAVFVLDSSGSSDVAGRCDAMFIQLNRIFNTWESDRFHLLVLATGESKESGGEPRVLTEATFLAPHGSTFENPGAEAGRRVSFQLSAYHRCVDALRPTKSSPIYQGLYRAVEAIQSKCSDLERLGGAACGRKFLAIQSDLREDGGNSIMERRIELAARFTGGRPTPELPQLARLKTEGITVTVCGVSNFKGNGKVAAEALDALPRAWNPILGEGAPVAYSPHCERTPPPLQLVAPTSGAPLPQGGK